MTMPSAALPEPDLLAALVRNAVAAASCGEPERANDLLEAVRPWLVAYFARHGSGSRSEDLAQVALVRIAGAVRRIEPTRAAGYIIGIARRERLREHRKRKSRVGPLANAVTLDAAGPLRADVDVVAEIEHLEVRRATRTACQVALDGVLRATMIAYLDGVSISEIAATQHVRPGTIRARLSRARRLLRRVLAPYLPDMPAAGAPADVLNAYPTRSPQAIPLGRQPPSPRRCDVNVTTQPSLDHYAYFDALACLDRADDEWRLTEAGLVMLRLVDQWANDPRPAMSADARADLPEVRALRELIGRIDPGLVYPRLLTGVVDAMLAARPFAGASALGAKLSEYAVALQFDARWAQAADVYRTVVAHVPVDDDPRTVAAAYVQLGACLRTLGDLDGAQGAYAAATWIARQHGDAVALGRARVGEAKIAMHRGNLPQAEAILDEVIAEAEATACDDVLARALMDRAEVAGRRGQFETGIVYGYRALRHHTEPVQQDRALADIATSLSAMGQRQAAREAHLVVAATAQEQYLRWASTINLLEIATLDGSEPHFERYRRELADAPLPPALAAYYHLYVGEGHRRFGDHGRAEAALVRAAEVARQYQVNEVGVRADILRRDLAAAAPAGSTPSRPASPAVAAVIRAITELRVLADVAED